MEDRYVEADENKKKLLIDANNLYGHSMKQFSFCDEIKLDKDMKLGYIFQTPDVSVIR